MGFAVGIAIWVGAFVAAGLSMVRAEMAYFHLYRAVKHDDFRLPNEMGPWGVFRPDRSTDELWKMVRERQAEPALEAARRRLIRRWKLTLAVLFVGPLIFIPLSYL